MTRLSRPLTALAAFIAMPEEGKGAAVVLPDVRGSNLTASTRSLCPAAALAIDYFARTAGVGTRDDGCPFKENLTRSIVSCLHFSVRSISLKV